MCYQSMYHYDLELLAALKIQFPANVPGEVSEDLDGIWYPGFSLGQSLLLQSREG